MLPPPFPRRPPLAGVITNGGCGPVALNPWYRVLEPTDQLVVAATNRSHAEAVATLSARDGLAAVSTPPSGAAPSQHHIQASSALQGQEGGGPGGRWSALSWLRPIRSLGLPSPAAATPATADPDAAQPGPFDQQGVCAAQWLSSNHHPHHPHDEPWLAAQGSPATHHPGASISRGVYNGTGAGAGPAAGASGAAWPPALGSTTTAAAAAAATNGWPSTLPARPVDPFALPPPSRSMESDADIDLAVAAAESMGLAASPSSWGRSGATEAPPGSTGAAGGSGNGRVQQLPSPSSSWSDADAAPRAAVAPENARAAWRGEGLAELRGHVILSGAAESFVEFATLLHKAAGSEGGCGG